MEAAAGSSTYGGGGGDRDAITTSPAAAAEKKLNSFVHAVALFERLGNALGTLAFTWATVVLLGGYPTVLRTAEDFAFATVVILLEALRMFSRDNRMDYQIFFRSRGSVRPLGWSGLIAVACICNVLELLAYLCGSAYGSGWAVWIRKLIDALMALAVLLTAVIGKLLSPGVLKHVPGQVRRFISLGSPSAAVLLLVPSLLKAASTKQSHTVVSWIIFTLLLVAVLLLTLSRLVDAGLGNNKYVFWRRIILNICIFAELVMLVFIHDSLRERIAMTFFQAYALLCVSFGNLLLPTAIVRVAMALKRLVPHDYSSGSEEQQHESRINLAPSLDIFYVMVLGQGILYLVSCTLDVFSFLPRRYLARQSGFRGYQGVESVNLYYEYAMEKCMEREVVARNRKQTNLDSFSIHSICSDSPKLQLHGVWMMHVLLRQEPSRTQILSKLHRDADAIARLINMLEWWSPEDADIRLFAAKVTAVLAGTFRVVSIPGAMQAFSALLDADSDGTKTESQDSLPGLAMSIFDRLASNSSYDFHNSCLEIIKASEDLIPKIIQFTCYRNGGNDMQELNTNEAAAVAQKKIFLMESALQLLGRLSSISGKIGVTLRHELMEYPILLTNLSAISEDRFSSQKARKLALVTLSILTM